MIGEDGQRILAERKSVPTSRKINTALTELPENHRPGDSRRRGRALGEALRGNHPEGAGDPADRQRIVRRVLTPAVVRRALESAYRDLASGEAVCRRASTSASRRAIPRSSTSGAPWRAVPPRLFRHPHEIRRRVRARVWGVRTREKYCSRPGRYCGLVFLTDVETGEPSPSSTTASCSTCASPRTAPSDRPHGAEIAAARASRVGRHGDIARRGLLEVREFKHLKVFSRRGRTRALCSRRSRSATGSSAKPSIRRRVYRARTFSRPAPIPRSRDPRRVARGGDATSISIGGRR